MTDPLLVSAAYGGMRPDLVSSSLPVLTPPPPPPAPGATMDASIPGTWTYAQGDDFTTVRPLYSNGMEPGDFWDNGGDSGDYLGTATTHTIEGGRLKMWPRIHTPESLGYDGLISRHLTTHSA